MFKIYPYKIGSASVKKLKQALDALIIKPEGSRYRYKQGDIIINWGNSQEINNLNLDVTLNQPEAVGIASNKLSTFNRLASEGVPHVPFTTDKATAESWGKVFVRNKLTGHSGEGIQVVEGQEVNSELEVAEELNQIFDEFYNSTDNERERFVIQELQRTLDENSNITVSSITLPDAPLYTKAITNNGEYRIHVFDGEVILYQKKSRRVDENGDVETADGEEADVRNLASNWIYRTSNLNRLERIETLAITAIESLGLDFGAVDIIKDEEGNVYVLEVNTAPGLGNTETLEAYLNAFTEIE